MKKFIVKSTFIFLPILFTLIIFDLFISYYPNTFNTKAKYLKSNLENIECLFLGSPHTQNSINPRYIKAVSANISYGSQDYQLDSALFFQYIPKLKNLKNVFIEMDYPSLDKKNSSDYFRLSWYYRFYGIDLGNLKVYEKACMFISNKTFFLYDLINKINPTSKTLKINKFGFVENDTDLFERLNFNKDIIENTAAERMKKKHDVESIDNFNFNQKKLLSIIHYCSENNIRVIILKNPVYSTYSNFYLKSKNDRRLLFLDSLSTYKNITILDYEQDPRFHVTDFKNDDHLNSNGGEKLSKLINEDIKQLN